MTAGHQEREDEDRILFEALRSAEDPEAAFRELFKRYQAKVLRFLARRGFDTETCRELSQETFLRVYKSRKSFRGEIPLSSWIFQIAGNLSRNEWRRRQTDKRSGEEKSLDGDAASDLTEVLTADDPERAPPLARALDREQVEAMREALEQLPTKMRRSMQMSLHHGYSVSEIAGIMQVTESTVKVHLHQARKRLRQALRDRFGELPF